MDGIEFGSCQVEEASKSINFVGFSAAPTSTDSTSVLNSITALKADFQAAQDPAVFLNKVGSDLPFYNSFISGKSIQIPNKEAIIAAGVGNVYGPYVDGKNYTIAKVIGVKQWPASRFAKVLGCASIRNTRRGR